MSKGRRCVACGGSGYYDDNGSPPCGSCRGSGYNNIRNFKLKKAKQDIKETLKDPSNYLFLQHSSRGWTGILLRRFLSEAGGKMSLVLVLRDGKGLPVGRRTVVIMRDDHLVAGESFPLRKVNPDWLNSANMPLSLWGRLL